MEERVCTLCNKEKSPAQFSQRQWGKKGRKCLICALTAPGYTNNGEDFFTDIVATKECFPNFYNLDRGKHRCHECGQLKPDAAFAKYRGVCKECNAKTHRRYIRKQSQAKNARDAREEITNLEIEVALSLASLQSVCDNASDQSE